MPFGSESTEPGIGLALSGGGFRAVLFHIGSILRLNDSGILSRLKRISSVSGGSIAAGALAVSWDQLQTDGAGRITNLEQEFVAPLRSFCGRTIDTWSVIAGALNPFKSAGEEVAGAYRKDLGMSKKLTELSDQGPRFVFNATNFATGVSFRFSKPYCGDYRIGLIHNPPFDVALAVACSSAFPPVLSPIEVDVDPGLFERTDGADLYDQVDFRRKLQLADGGVYDNLGLETVWGRYDTILVSDAGKPFEIDAGISVFAPKQILRVMDIGLNQALALRKRMLIHQFEQGVSKGTFWAINTQISKYPVQGALPVSQQKILELSSIRTRLDKFSEQEQCELVNWGYAVTDAAIRAQPPALGGPFSPVSLPYPDFPLS
jgi:NTE family protein